MGIQLPAASLTNPGRQTHPGTQFESSLSFDSLLSSVSSLHSSSVVSQVGWSSAPHLLYSSLGLHGDAEIIQTYNNRMYCIFRIYNLGYRY